jgi:signal transduction histidine kinase
VSRDGRPPEAGADERPRSEARDPVTEPSVVVGGLVPIGAAVLLSLVVGIRDLVLLVALLGGAMAVTGASWWLIQQRARGQRPRSSGAAYEVAFALCAPVLTTLYGLAVLERPIVAFGLVVVLPFVTASYVLPKRLQLPLQCYALAIWTGGLLVVGVDLRVVVGHAVGGVALALISNRIADQQRARRVRESVTRERAEALMQLLTSVQQVNSLEPRAVLGAVIDGLRGLGLADAEVREVDPAAGVARLVAGQTDLDVVIENEVPLDLPLIREALDRPGPVVIADAGSDPRVTRRVGYRSGAILALPLGDGGRGLLSVATVEGPVTPLQLEAMELLADHAARALERASVYEADLRIVEDLRRLDVRTQDFVSTASHELRTPLTVISGLGQTLRQRWDDLDAGRRDDLLQRIDANAERLATMIHSLLDTSALERGELEPDVEVVPLRATVAKLLDRLATVTAAHPVDNEIGDALEVMVDRSLFEHVVENLLTNVAKHTPQGTQVVVSAETEGEHIRVTVADHGPGIAAQDLPHVLDRFYRGGDPDRRPTGGLGLGLALSQQIVRAHGGELQVTSEPGAGTTFSFSVPSAAGQR